MPNPFSFEGRLGRLQYFAWSCIFVVGLWIVSFLLAGAIGSNSNRAAAESSIVLIVAVLSFTYFLVNLTLGVRRLHDMDKSGWWYLLSFVPVLNFILGLVLLFAPGTPGANQYGTR